MSRNVLYVLILSDAKPWLNVAMRLLFLNDNSSLANVPYSTIVFESASYADGDALLKGHVDQGHTCFVATDTVWEQRTDHFIEIGAASVCSTSIAIIPKFVEYVEQAIVEFVNGQGSCI